MEISGQSVPLNAPHCLRLQVAAELTSGLTLAATGHMRAAGHLDAAADLLARHSDASGGGGGGELLVARASLRIDQVWVIRHRAGPCVRKRSFCRRHC